MIEGWDLKHCWKRACAQAAREAHFAVADPQSIVEKTREFQTQLLHYFSKSDNKSNHHHQPATQLPQRRIQVVCINMVARKRLTESNGTPAMDLGHMNVVLKQYYFYVLFYDC